MWQHGEDELATTSLTQRLLTLAKWPADKRDYPSVVGPLPVMMSVLYRCALINRVSKLKTRAMFSTMAEKSGKRSSTSASAEDGSARVRRVSIEGNIGKISIFTVFVSSYECWLYVILFHVLSNISCWKVDLCKTLAVSLSRLGGGGRTCQQVAEHWGWDQEGVHVSWPLNIYITISSLNKNQSWPSLLVSLTGDRCVPSPDDSQQPAADDVPGPSALVVHLSDIFLYEPAENTAAASSSSPAQLRGNTCPGVWALDLQRQVSQSGQESENEIMSGELQFWIDR